MKKILLAIATVIVSMTASAQVIDIEKDSKVAATYDNSYKAVLRKETGKTLDDNKKLIQAWFSVSPTKKVQFTKGNLYYNTSTSTYAFETNQYDIVKTWDANHVIHFFWTTKENIANSYLSTYNEPTIPVSTSDVFFADGRDNNHMMTVNDLSNLYVLSSSEWAYLLGNTAERAGKCKIATINDNVCLVIVPDKCKGTYIFDNAKETYTTEEWSIAENAGLVCLPASGCRDGQNILSTEDIYYWSATTDAVAAGLASYLCILEKGVHGISPAYGSWAMYKYANCIRLVK